MTEHNRTTWPGSGDRAVIEDMLRDRDSEHWYECHRLVQSYVSQATNIPKDQREDIVQEVMFKINRYLYTFQYQCAFRSWIFRIVQNCLIDVYRKLSSIPRLATILEDSHNDEESDDEERKGDTFFEGATASAEDESMMQDELDEALLALQEYVVKHGKKRRNARILELVIFEHRTFEEAAKAVGCSAPVAGYIVRSAQHYVRQKLDRD